ncbi:GNAT family N-acetyltransferase [Pseudoalteromonas sp. MEBiC 03607]|uniref:GNAT family N-acetyltransferase n=1 Tax=Pseudoalteromonas sp. MEBiC 03607 TaxID=2563601 RepID=UPI000C485098|nr:GNAT family N-acetyltransferase [Pseudoalteromonas sp. MEBiC 03607]MBD57654.1 GNAT family N-acetyltransferase [Pseudoalteromonas sp.]TGV17093.1 GNAT family N-acetyltransferase [Pseudoalteromonas sp. MEBiC 03607]
MKIESVNSDDYPELLDVWENSVRATHDFITEDDIAFFKPIIIEQAFPNVTLKCIKSEHKTILGFVGVHDSKIEMLFILDAARGKGVGKALLNYAIEQLAANKVDVNEQNPLAVGFYQHMGFKVASRSPLDDMGKPFPILHMRLKTPCESNL